MPLLNFKELIHVGTIYHELSFKWRQVWPSLHCSPKSLLDLNLALLSMKHFHDQARCARNSQRYKRDAALAKERLEALEPVVEDWHTKMCLFQVKESRILFQYSYICIYFKICGIQTSWYLEIPQFPIPYNDSWQGLCWPHKDVLRLVDEQLIINDVCTMFGQHVKYIVCFVSFYNAKIKKQWTITALSHPFFETNWTRN